MTGRDEMLDRIRKALGRTSQVHDSTGGSVVRTPGDMTGVLPPIPPEQWLSKFEAEWTKVGGIPHRAKSLPELEDIVKKILAGCDAKSVVFSRNPLLASLKLAEKLRASGTSVSVCPPGEPAAAAATKFREACFAAEVGITGADFVLAESGSLAVTSATEGAQLSSLAPPVHVAIYRRSQLLGSLDDLLAKLSDPTGSNPLAAGRSIVFITGTSRTADIEQILIRGVHGPREVHAILVEDSCL